MTTKRDFAPPLLAMRRLVREERALMLTGLAGVVQSIVVGVVIAFRGAFVSPEGDLRKVVTGSLALGVFTLTAAAYLPLARLGARARATWRWALIASATYSYFFEPAQHARGIDPRLSDFWSPVDHAFSVVYLVTSQVYVALVIGLFIGLWRARATNPCREPIVALLYGAGSMFVGFAAGYRMVFHYDGRVLGAANLALVHGFAFHGLQAMLLVAWLVTRAKIGASSASSLVHLAGLGWLTSALMLGAHVLSGRALTELTPALVMAGFGFLVFSLVVGELAIGSRTRATARALALGRRAQFVAGALAFGATFAAWPTLAEGSDPTTPSGTLAHARRSSPGADVPELVALVGGTVTLGCAEGDPSCDRDERRREVYVPAFKISRTEVSRAAYDGCVGDGACMPVEDATCKLWQRSPDQPVTCVDWAEASRFCRWIGGRLPTADEWEYAARSGDGAVYPWGDASPDRSRASWGGLFDGPGPVAGHPQGATKWGLLHMADNVREWTASDYDARYKEIRGGAWNTGTRQLRASNRAGQRPEARSAGLGFRCAA